MASAPVTPPPHDTRHFRGARVPERANARQGQASRAVLEEFEPRVLYAADLAAVAGGVPLGSQVQHHGLTELAGPRGLPGVELVVVDSSLPDSHTLLAGLQAQRDAGRRLEIVTLAAGSDGIAAVSQALQGQSSVAAVHLLSHGQAGAVQLGATTLDAPALMQRAAEIAGWGDALAQGADLLIYGCDVAANAAGLQLTQALAALTGADVAASTDLTGDGSLGGDWVLEARTGTIEVAAPLGDATTKAWQKVMLTGTPSWRVNVQTGAIQETDALHRGSTQSVAYAANGRFVVVWTSDNQDGDRRGVYFRLYEANGTAIGTTETLVNTETNQEQRYATVAMADNGSFVVTWASNDQDGNGWGIYAQRFDANGVRQGPEFRVNSHTSGDQTNPVIGMNRSTGNFVIAWEGEGSTQSWGIYSQRYAANGTAQGGNLLVSTTNRGSETNPTVAMDRQGRFVVAWDVGGDVYAQRFTAAGSATGAELQVNGSSDAERAAVAMDAQGNFSIVFRQSKGDLGIFVRGYLADGSDRYQARKVSVADGSSGSLALDAAGNAVITWLGSGTSGQDVLLRRLDAAGQFVASVGADAATILQVNTETAPVDMVAGNQASPSVALMDLEHFVVVWSGRVGSDADGVAARRFALPPTSPQVTSYGGAASVARTVAENSRTVAIVTATDANQPVEPSSYRVVLTDSANPDGAWFELVPSVDPATGLNRAELRFVTAPNFEQPRDADEDNVYRVRVEVSDGTTAAPVTQDFVVTVTDVADTATALDGGFSVQVSTTGSLPVMNLVSSSVSTDLRVVDVTLPAGVSGADPVTLIFAPTSPTDPVGYQAPATGGASTFDYRVNDGQADLRHYWQLDEAVDGGAVRDVVGNHAPGYGPSDATPVQGRWGYGVDLAASGDEVRIPDVDYGSGFTLGLWFQLTNFGTGYQTLLSHGSPGQANSLTIQVAGSSAAIGDMGQLIIELRDGDDAAAGRVSTDIWSNVGDGRWHYLLLTVQPGVGAAAYLDDMATPFGQTSAGGGLVNPSTDLVLGRTVNGTQEFNGRLDSLALWGHALTANERAEAHAPTVSAGTITVDVTGSTAVPAPTGSADRYRLNEDGAIAAGEFATTAWLAPGWTSRQRIDLNNMSGAAMVDTPVLITLAPGTVDHTRINSGGTDLRFFDSTGTALAFQIETWNPGGTSTVWVRAPNIAMGSSAIWMYYENADATTNPQDAAGVWGAGAAAVLHMGDGLVDVSPNALTPVGSADLSAPVAGRLGTATDFNGSTSDLNLGSPAAVDDIFGTGQGNGGTVSAWIFARDAGEGNYGRIADKTDNELASRGWAFHLSSSGQLYFEYASSLGLWAWRTPSTEVISFGSWQHVAVSFDATDMSKEPTFFINGRAITGQRFLGLFGSALSDADQSLHVGNHASAPTYTFNGAIDELRIYASPRSTASIAGEYAAGAAGLVTVNPTVERAPVLADDTGNGTLTAELLTGPAHAASFQLYADGRFDYQPQANYNGQDSFTYRPRDGALTGDPVTVTLAIGATPDVPVIQTPSNAVSYWINRDENQVAVTSYTATDADEAASELRWSLVDTATDARSTDVAHFAIDAVTGAVRFVAAPDFETPTDSNADGTYSVVVRVTDTTGRTDDQLLHVRVVNQQESSLAQDDVATTAPNVPVTIAVMGNDRLDALVNSEVLDVSHGSIGRATLTGSSVVYTPLADQFGVDTLRYRLVDANENLTRYWRLDGTATDVAGTSGGSLAGTPGTTPGVWGDALQFDTEDDVAVLGDINYGSSFSLGFWFRLDGTGSSNAPTLFTHGSWGQAQSLSVYFERDPDTGQLTVLRTALRDADDAADISGLNVAVLDGLGGSLTDDAWHHYMLVVGAGSSTVFVDGVQRATSDHGGGVFAPLGSALLGQATDDPGARAGSSRPLAGDIDSLALYATALDIEGVQRAMTGGSSSAEVHLSVGADVPPVIVSDGGQDTASVTRLETDTFVTQVVAQDPYNASPTLHYAIVGGTHASNFTIDATTGELYFRGPPDTEGVWTSPWVMPFDGPQGTHVYQVQVEARDALAPAGQTDTQTLTITVRDVDDQPLRAVVDIDDLSAGPATANDRVGEEAVVGTAVGVTARALDTDHAAVVTYALLDDARGLVRIDPATGVVTTASSLQGLGGRSLSFTVQATSGAHTQQAVFTVAVLDSVDDGPVSAPQDIDTAEDTVAEGAPAGTSVGIVLQAFDPDPSDQPVTFALVDNPGNRYRLEAIGAGQVRLVTNAVFDLDAAGAPAVDSIAVAAYSGRSPSGAISRFTVTVTPVDEHPVSTPVDTDASVNQLAENAAAGSPVLGLQIQATDPDLPSTVSFRLTNDAQGRFVIDPSSGRVTTARALDFETDGPRHLITVQARSGDSVAEASFDIELTDLNDLGWVRLEDVDSRPNAVDESAAIGSPVGLHVQAVDADTSGAGPVTYSLLDDAAGRFVIDDSGTVRLARDLAEEGFAEHRIVVQASSAEDGLISAAFTVRVIATNDLAPVISLPAGTVAEGTLAVGQVTARDGDAWPGETVARSVTLRISGGADAALFALDPATGQLSFLKAPDFEAPADADRNNRYELQISADDGELSSQALLTVTITGIDEPPVIVTHVLDVQNGVTRVDLVTTDPETPADRRTFRVSGETGGWLALSHAPLVRLETFTQAQVDAGQIIFRLDGSGRTPGYQLTVSDGSFTVGPAAALVKVVGALPVASLNLPTAAAAQDAPADAAAASGKDSSEEASEKPGSIEGLLAKRPTGAGSDVDALLADRAAADGGSRAADSAAAAANRSAGGAGFSTQRGAGASGGALGGEPGAAGGGEARPATLAAAPALAWKPVSGLDLSDASTSRQLQAVFDKLRDEVAGDTTEVTVAIGSTALLSGGLSVGYVLWLLRGGVLIATVMSTVPAWAGIDPLPVLAQHRRDEDDEGENDADPIERLFSRARKLVGRGAEHTQERPTQAANLTPEGGA